MWWECGFGEGKIIASEARDGKKKQGQKEDLRPACLRWSCSRVSAHLGFDMIITLHWQPVKCSLID